MFHVKSKHSYIDLFEGMIIGGTLAAVATFIFGTKKGKDLQKELIQEYKKLGHITKGMRKKIEKTIETHTASKIKRTVKTKAKKALKRGKRKIKAAKKLKAAKKQTRRKAAIESR